MTQEPQGLLAGAMDPHCLCCCRPLSEHNEKRQCPETTYFVENVPALTSLAAKDAEIAGLRHEAQFLCDRLDSLEWSDGLSGYEQVLREYFGHVEPSHARLKALLHENPESKA